jgi:3-dehydroquinate dehydratase / shikimate dehydrogenase
MFCATVAQTSQRLAVFDMFNASQSCDLIELRLDRFDKAPDFGQLFEKKFKPVIVACRRKRDGGDWSGSEEERLAILRQAVLAKADYIEIEADVADKVRRYGETKRIISSTHTMEAPDDLAEIYQECLSKDPDVVKITMPTRTPEEAWPLIKAVAKATAPTVAVGWGRGGRLLSILGRRYKSPWTYAALERGMEAYPGMATVHELKNAWDHDAIDSRTPLLGISGSLEEQTPLALMLNEGFRLAGDKTRCLPLDIGEVELFQKVVDAIRLAGVIVDERNRRAIVDVLHDAEEVVEEAGACDFVQTKEGKWKGFSATPRAVLSALEHALKNRRPEEPAFDGKSFVVVGTSGVARGIATALKRKNAVVIVADKHNDRAAKTAEEVGVRYIPNGQVYSILSDGMILTADADAEERGVGAIAMPKSVAREGLAVVDLTRTPFMTPLLDEARVVRGLPIPPAEILGRTVQIVLKAYTGKTPALEALVAALEKGDVDYSDPAGAPVTEM